MTDTSTPSAGPAADRPVLFWRPDSDESRVEANLARAAEFLNVSPDAVVAAIDSGDLLGNWFVDWQAAGASDE